MKSAKDQLLFIELNGIIIHESHEGMIIRAVENGVWDSSFEVMGATRIGTDNDHNHCIMRFDCFGQFEVYLNGALHPAENIELRFWGPWEYRAALEWLEAVGMKAAEIKLRER